MHVTVSLKIELDAPTKLWQMELVLTRGSCGGFEEVISGNR